MDNSKELEVIYDLRNVLIDLYPSPEDSEKYIIANELLTELETIVRGRITEKIEED